MIEKFFITQRDLNFETDDKFTYDVGPINIFLNTYNNTIIVSMTPTPNFNIEDFINIIKPVWEFNDLDILEKNDHKIIIKYNFTILNNHLSYSIHYGSL